MVDDAERHAEEDKAQRDAVETKNMAENIVYQTEKLLKEQGDKLPADKKEKAEKVIEDLKKATEGGNTEEIKAKIEALNTEMQAMSADLYSQPEAQAGAEGEANAPGGAEADAGTSEKKDDEGDVIDADFEMVDDEKK